MSVPPSQRHFPDRIETERLVLRAPAPGDAAELRGAIAETFDALHRWMDWATHVPSLEEEREILRTRRAAPDRGEEGSWLMTDRATGALVGSGGFPEVSWERRSFEIGYWVRASCEGRGYVSESVRALTAVCFERWDARRVDIHCSALNARSRRVAERAGFRHEHTRIREGVHPDGSDRDTVIYALYAPVEVDP